MNLAEEISYILGANVTALQRVELMVKLFRNYQEYEIKQRFAPIVGDIKKDFPLSYTEKDMDRHGIAKFNEGYDQATAEMEAENTNWYRRGYNEGVVKGDKEGYARGKRELDAVYNQGLVEGVKQRNDTIAVAERRGYERGLVEGTAKADELLSTEHKRGYDKGYEDAKKDIPKLQQQELDEHREAGNEYGYNNGRADGYDAGHIDGFNKGYLKGRKIERIDALKESTKEYQRGVADGKKQIIDFINNLNKG